MGSQRKILIIEDDLEIVEIMQRKLTNDGFVAYVADSGEKALKLFSQINPDMMLVDIVLPDIYGPEIITKLKERNPDFSTPVLFLSGVIDNSEQGSTIKVGGELYPAIGKPFTWGKLISKLNEIME